MNTNALKRFAREARIKLLDQVGRKLNFTLSNNDPVFMDTYASQIKSLKEKIIAQGKELVIETVAYTWFNRLMALRFMDANSYTIPKVVTPLIGKTPEILQNALSGQVDDALNLNRQRLNELLDGKTVIADAQTEAFKMLLISACNYWHSNMPFMFERIADYTELLLPDDLLSDYSIVADIRNGMSDEGCLNEEILGWLYQFYISDENERLISSKKVYTKNELAPASQLFTPKWIVKYMVDNTLGQLWSEINPATTILNKLEFYIKPAYKKQLQPRPKKKIEEINFYDPCVGSAHILSYAFDVFYLMYEEQGYNTSEIPISILKYNLFGTDIDERAAQIASFVLMMKGRRKNSRFLRKNVIPNITFYQDFESDPKFNNAKAIGSLIKVSPEDIDVIQIEEGSVFAENQRELKKLYIYQGQRYDCVVTNPPYISSSRMEGTLKQYVEENYPDTKSDLFATFILKCTELCKEDGFTGYMSPFVWMFISSYEKLRNFIIDKHFINNLIQLEYSGFDGATVPICTFTLRCKPIQDAKGSYIRLSDFKGPVLQEPKTLEAIQNPNCGWFYVKSQNEFVNAPEKIICYWLSAKAITLFKTKPALSSKFPVRVGLSTSDSPRFLRLWHEVSFDKIGINIKNTTEAKASRKKWFPLNKGGNFRKWFGNNEYIINFHNDGEELKHWLVNNPNDPSTKSWSRYIRSPKFYFKPSLTWTKISSGSFSIRFSENGFIFSDASNGIFPDNREDILILIGLLNSEVVKDYLTALSPTLNFKSGDIGKIPIESERENKISDKVEDCIRIAKADWNLNETSWEFEKLKLIESEKDTLSEACSYFIETCNLNIISLAELEKKINIFWDNIYGIENRKSIGTVNDNITLLKPTVYRIVKDLISYGIGNIFGRYSLDKPGLILANQRETLQDYLRQIPDPSFMPDEDDIIPVLDGEWFTDDIVSRLKAFIKAAFGEEHFEENIKFLEDTLGKDIRKYLLKDFYIDHIKRYKKRPIYWMFNSPKGHFKALIYMHRYQTDLCSKLLKDYLQFFISKLEETKHTQTMFSFREDISPREKTLATKDIDRLDTMLKDCRDYEITLFSIATRKINIDLDDGVKLNYLKFREVLLPIKGLEKDEE